MKKYSIYLILFLSLMSCEKESYENNPKLISEYTPFYMDYPYEAFLAEEFKVKLRYNNGKVSQRIGALMHIGTHSGYTYCFKDFITDEVTYSKNRITITKGLIPVPGITSIDTNKRVLFFENNKLVKRVENKGVITDWYGSSYPEVDTLYYFYNDRDQIEKITESSNFNLHHYTKRLTYNDKGNLVMIVVDDFYNSSSTSYTIRDTIIYSGYDNAPNLMRNLGIFKECFIRSLSENNYSKYLKKSYNDEGVLISEEEKNWDLVYDAENNIIF